MSKYILEENDFHAGITLVCVFAESPAPHQSEIFQLGKEYKIEYDPNSRTFYAVNGSFKHAFSYHDYHHWYSYNNGRSRYEMVPKHLMSDEQLFVLNVAGVWEP